jgi:phospholipid transport system substrate-binding protein
VPSLRFNVQWIASRMGHGLAVMAVAFVALAMVPRAAQAAESQDVAYVHSLAQKVMDIVNDSALSQSQKETRLGTVIDTNLDIVRIAKFTLGKYRRVASSAEMDQFIPLFRKYAVGLYQARLSQYHGGAQFKVTSSEARANGQGTIVHSTVSTGDQPQPYNLEWWVVDIKGQPTIIDVNIEGVWMAQNLRSQFVSVMDQHGGKVSALIDQLKGMIAQQQQEPAGTPQHT